MSEQNTEIEQVTETNKPELSDMEKAIYEEYQKQRKEYMRRYYEEHKEQIRQKNRERYLKKIGGQLKKPRKSNGISVNQVIRKVKSMKN